MMTRGSPSAKFVPWPKLLPTAPMNTRGTAVAQRFMIKLLVIRAFGKAERHYVFSENQSHVNVTR